MLLKTARLEITCLTMDMAEAMCANSQEEDNRRFVPDEVYETPEEARKAVAYLIEAERTERGPFVYPVLLRDGTVIGYVQACEMETGFEAGYHIAKAYTGQGYATEAVTAFAPAIMDRLGISELWGIALEENRASHRVLEKCGFALVNQGMGSYQGQQRLLRRYVLRR